MSYEYRGRCVRVVDGDTVDLEVDMGFYLHASLRFRLYGVDTPELNSSDPAQREQALEAKRFVEQALPTVTAIPYPLRIRTHKADSFGRWLAEIWYPDANGGESYLGGELLALGLAKEWTR